MRKHKRRKLTQRQRTSKNGGPYEVFGNSISNRWNPLKTWFGPKAERNRLTRDDAREIE